MLNLPAELCYGCSSCVSACPNNCLKMVENSDGFLVPELTDTTLCTNCDLCNKSCPVFVSPTEKEKTQKSYIVQNNDPEILSQSTSGGAFTAIANCVLDKGVIY